MLLKSGTLAWPGEWFCKEEAGETGLGQVAEVFVKEFDIDQVTEWFWARQWHKQSSIFKRTFWLLFRNFSFLAGGRGQDKVFRGQETSL